MTDLHFFDIGLDSYIFNPHLLIFRSQDYENTTKTLHLYNRSKTEPIQKHVENFLFLFYILKI